MPSGRHTLLRCGRSRTDLTDDVVRWHCWWSTARSIPSLDRYLPRVAPTCRSSQAQRHVPPTERRPGGILERRSAGVSCVSASAVCGQFPDSSAADPPRCSMMLRCWTCYIISRLVRDRRFDDSLRGLGRSGPTTPADSGHAAEGIVGHGVDGVGLGMKAPAPPMAASGPPAPNHAVRVGPGMKAPAPPMAANGPPAPNTPLAWAGGGMKRRHRPQPRTTRQLDLGDWHARSGSS